MKNFIQLPCMRSSIWTSLCCFPQLVSRVQNQKWNNQDTKQHPIGIPMPQVMALSPHHNSASHMVFKHISHLKQTQKENFTQPYTHTMLKYWKYFSKKVLTWDTDMFTFWQITFPWEFLLLWKENRDFKVNKCQRDTLGCYLQAETTWLNALNGSSKAVFLKHD